MAISWDFTAAAKAQAAGQAASARESANAIKSVQQGFATRETIRRNQEIERVNEERAAAAQQGVVDKFNKETADTFNIPANADGKDYGNVNEIFDYSANSLVKTYTRIYNDKDMDRDERALALKKLTNQIPLFKTAQAALNKNIGAYAEGALTGSISKAMSPKFQEMYSELSNGDFDGGIDYVDGETRLTGITKGGHEIDLPLRDFAKNLPPIENSQGTITDALDAERAIYKARHEAYVKDPMKNPLPVWNQKEQEAKISEQIAGITGNGLKIYGMDVLNYTSEQIDEKLRKYMDGDISRDAIPEKTLLSLDPSQQSRFGPDNSKMTEPEAIVYVTEDLAEEMAGIQKKYLDQTNYLKPYTPKRVQDPLFIQQVDQGYQNKEGSFTIDDITIEDDRYAPDVKDFIEKDEIITITKAGAEDKEGVAFPDKTIEIDLTNSDDVLKYITGPDYMRYAKGQSEERLANKKAIIRANEIAKENIAKRNKRRKEEASEAGKEKNQFQKYFPENSFGPQLP